MEVCAAYQLYRETFYLAADFLDRYMDLASNVERNRLQLIAVTCLFIGAKLEEIYPPTVPQLAYLTGRVLTVVLWIRIRY